MMPEGQKSPQQGEEEEEEQQEAVKRDKQLQQKQHRNPAVLSLPSKVARVSSDEAGWSCLLLFE